MKKIIFTTFLLALIIVKTNANTNQNSLMQEQFKYLVEVKTASSTTYSSDYFKTEKEAQLYLENEIKQNSAVISAKVIYFKNNKKVNEMVFKYNKVEKQTADLKPMQNKKAEKNTSSEIKVNKSVEKSTEGLTFSVQVCATSISRVVPQLVKKVYHITENITVKSDNVYNRYFVGSLATYAEAKQYVNKLKNENSIKDAFVVGFVNGERLPSLSGMVKSLSYLYLPWYNKLKSESSLTEKMESNLEANLLF